MSSESGARRQDIKFPDPKVRTPTILVVDDEFLVRMAISDFLQECGFKVLEASDGEEALQMIKSYAMVLDLVFADVLLPGEIDGFALSRWIREHRPQIPVILCSADAKKAEAAEELCAGEPFLTKPFDFKIALAHVRQLLDKDKDD
jgi:CheY-like chemotaxis protein